MASPASSAGLTAKYPHISVSDVESFQTHLQSSTRVLALIGAGLSASSGLPTFRGAGGLWRTHEATDLATPQAFDADPALVWQFYSYRRHMALKAKPNKAHYALAELAKRRPGFWSLSQNVDGKILKRNRCCEILSKLTVTLGLSPRAGHPRSSLHLLHGSLFDIKCTGFYCKYFEPDNYVDPIVPALALPTDESDPTTNKARTEHEKELDIADENVVLPELALRDLPHCPSCQKDLLRPGVVWFGERLPEKTLQAVDGWIGSSPTIDLILVIGTSAKVYPAAAYVDRARHKGARVAVINTDRDDVPAGGLEKGDWFFQGDAAVILPELFKPVIGDLADVEEKL
jgi:NAD+-dependent protein deacetylase sirtuin 5